MNKLSRKLVLSAVCALSSGVADAGSFTGPGDCRAVWDETCLTVGNDLFSRRWRLDGSVLRTVSFGLSGAKNPFVAGEVRGRAQSGLKVSCRVDRDSAVSKASLLVSAEASGRTMHVRLFPSVPGVVIFKEWNDDVSPAPSAKDYVAANRDASWGLQQCFQEQQIISDEMFN